jgi:hypothetical protein
MSSYNPHNELTTVLATGGGGLNLYDYSLQLREAAATATASTKTKTAIKSTGSQKTSFTVKNDNDTPSLFSPTNPAAKRRKVVDHNRSTETSSSSSSSSSSSYVIPSTWSTLSIPQQRYRHRLLAHRFGMLAPTILLMPPLPMRLPLSVDHRVLLSKKRSRGNHNHVVDAIEHGGTPNPSDIISQLNNTAIQDKHMLITGNPILEGQCDATTIDTTGTTNDTLNNNGEMEESNHQSWISLLQQRRSKIQQEMDTETNRICTTFLHSTKQLQSLYLHGLQTVKNLTNLRYAPDAILPGNLVVHHPTP